MSAEAEQPGGDVLSDEVLRRLDDIGSADLLIGIPSLNSARTIGYVIATVEGGLRKHFPGMRGVICVSDGGSTDGTTEAAARAGVGDRHRLLLVPEDAPIPEKLCFAYRGPSGKGSAFRSIFEVAARLGVRACAVVDSDLRSITPYWIDRLLSPIVHHGFEYVSPIYTRHKFDGTITNSIAYPLTSALYGARIRQPIGGEFGFSGDLASVYAAEDVWKTDVARFGIDIWMTTVAIVEGHRTCQAILGAKIHDPKDPGKDLGPMFRQVVGSLFALAGRYRDRWWDVEGSTVPPSFGYPAAFSADPVQVSVPRLTWKFIEGYVRHHRVWREVLSPESMAEIERGVGDASESQIGYVLGADLWVGIVYDYLVAYNARRVEPGPLLDSFIPLYFARTASFVNEVRDADQQEAEAKVEELADLAVATKPYLRRRWTEEGVPVRELAEQSVPEHGETPEGVEAALTQGGA
jgi:glucosylglycerate synthase